MIEAFSSLALGQELGRFLLVLVRVSGIVALTPIFSSNVLPVRFRISLAFALAVVLMPLVPVPTGVIDGAGAWVVVIIRELAVGLAFGIAARVIIDGLEGAAHLIAGQSGFAFSSMVDPLTGSQSVAPALFQGLLATTLLLAANLHHLFIRGLVHSYELLPPGPTLLASDGLLESAGVFGGRLFVIAVELAGPGLIVTFAVDLVLILVGRAMPQVPVLIVGYPLKVTAGVISMALLAFGTGSALRWIGETFVSDGAALIAALQAR